MPKGYHVLLGWNLKGIRETFGVLIYDPQLAICVSTPIESMILEWKLSLRVLVSLRSKWRCNWNCTPLILHEICKWYDVNVKMQLILHLKHLFFWGGTWKRLERLLGEPVMIINWPSVYPPHRIYDPGTRTIPESSGMFQKQSSGIWWIGLSWGLLMGWHTLENAQMLSCSLGVELERDLRDFWGANLWLSIGRQCIHPYPYRIFDPGPRTIPKSSGIFEKEMKM